MHKYNTRSKTSMKSSVNPGHSEEAFTEEELLIDMSPSQLSRSLQRNHSSSDDHETTGDEDVQNNEPKISTPTPKVRRSTRTIRQQRGITPTDTCYAELSEPLTPTQQQNNAVTDSMKLMMEQMAQTMKAMQGMMEATTETLRQVDNQKQSKKSKLSKLNSNNNKLDPTKSCHEESSENTDESEIEQSTNSIATEDLFKSKKSDSNKHDCKLPPYTGSEKWKVWLNRFESVAKLANWTSREKLQQLLPRIQGNAADFVFGQLKEETMASYENLVAEIGSRFGTLENKRVYKTQFNNKRQGRNESLEEYAADIKRLYDWAHPNRDASTRQEDLISKFLQGLLDSKARQYIELHREPSSIEEAVQQVAAYMSVTSNSVPNDERRPIRQARTYEKGDNSTSGKENPKPRNTERGNCFLCNLPGHFARECPNKNKRQRPNYRKFPPRQANKSPQASEEKQPATSQNSAPSTMSPDAPEFHPNYQQNWTTVTAENCGQMKENHLNGKGSTL